MLKISVVVNTWNEEKNIERCLKSARQLADEIVVVDMHSTDKTVEIAKKHGAKVFFHRYSGYVESARNFALRCAQGKHILVLDADEEIPASLAKQLKQIAKENKFDYVRIPRKNIIFGKWIKHSRWWPDYVIRFFKKGKVVWPEKIHQVPQTKGKGVNLEAKESHALVHRHYQSISQYLKRMNRYTDIQAKELIDSGYKFTWQDLVRKPASEFLSRFFAGEGYKDGLHGLALALLQAFSELVLYLKVWEANKFKEIKEEVLPEFKKLQKELVYWLLSTEMKKSKNFLKRLILKIKRRFL